MATTSIDTYILSGSKPTIKKDPNATLDYPFDWSAWLAVVGDTIASVQWILDPSLVLVSSSFTAVTATPFISGGTPGTKVPVTCRITTTHVPTARVEDRTIVLSIAER